MPVPMVWKVLEGTASTTHIAVDKLRGRGLASLGDGRVFLLKSFICSYATRFPVQFSLSSPARRETQ